MNARHRIPLAATLALAAAMLAACAPQQEYAYFKHVPRHVEIPVQESYSNTIFPDDQLYIEVHSQSPLSTVPFNQGTVRDPRIVGANTTFLTDTLHVDNKRGYLVSADGTIDFPLIGRVQAAGLSLDSLATDLTARLRNGNYVSDALVTVKLMNFRVAVIGEVKNPTELRGDGNRMTIYEALAQCGDITMDGLRTEVVIVRRSPAGQQVDTVDLTTRDILESPYYYLQQGDIVYVPPTEKKRKQAYRDDDWPHYISTGVAGLRLAYMIIRNIIAYNT